MTLQILEESTARLVEHVAQDFAAYVQETLAQRQRFTWALSGGNTPRELFHRLTHEPYRSAIPWERLWVFWGDERLVSPDDPQSNFRMAQEALLSHVPVPKSQILRMKGELPAAEAARDYEAQVKAVFGPGSPQPRFDLILLGMGPDGHTASLFPETTALAVTDRWVTANWVPKLNATRLTLTLPVLNAARAVWFLATGPEKAAVFAQVQKGANPSYPASLVMAQSGNVRWYVDHSILQP